MKKAIGIHVQQFSFSQGFLNKIFGTQVIFPSVSVYAVIF